MTEESVELVVQVEQGESIAFKEADKNAKPLILKQKWGRHVIEDGSEVGASYSTYKPGIQCRRRRHTDFVCSS